MLTEPGLQTVCEMGISISCEAFNAICNSFLWKPPEISVNMARVHIQISLYFRLLCSVNCIHWLPLGFMPALGDV
jgi:hypothetical protein